jgi:hypothetical protein
MVSVTDENGDPVYWERTDNDGFAEFALGTDEFVRGRRVPRGREEARGDVWRLAHRELLRAAGTADSLDEHLPGVDAHADPQRLSKPSAPLPVDRLHRQDDVKPGAYRAFDIVLMCSREAEIDQDAVAEILGDVPLVPPHDRLDLALVVADEDAEVLGVEPLGERGGPDEVTEDDRELSPLALG